MNTYSAGQQLKERVKMMIDESNKRLDRKMIQLGLKKPTPPIWEVWSNQAPEEGVKEAESGPLTIGGMMNTVEVLKEIGQNTTVTRLPSDREIQLEENRLRRAAEEAEDRAYHRRHGWGT